MSYKARLLELVKQVRGEQVAFLLELSEVEEIDEYVGSMRRCAEMLGQEFPELPDLPEEEGVEAPAEAEAGQQPQPPAPAAPQGPAPAKPADKPAEAKPQATAKPQAAAQAGAARTPADEKRARLLARIAKILKLAAPAFRSAPVEQLEAFAMSLEKSYRELAAASKSAGAAGQAQAKPDQARQPGRAPGPAGQAR